MKKAPHDLQTKTTMNPTSHTPQTKPSVDGKQSIQCGNVPKVGSAVEIQEKDKTAETRKGKPTYCAGCNFKCQATECECTCHDRMREYYSQETDFSVTDAHEPHELEDGKFDSSKSDVSRPETRKGLDNCTHVAKEFKPHESQETDTMRSTGDLSVPANELKPKKSIKLNSGTDSCKPETPCVSRPDISILDLDVKEYIHKAVHSTNEVYRFAMNQYLRGKNEGAKAERDKFETYYLECLSCFVVAPYKSFIKVCSVCGSSSLHILYQKKEITEGSTSA